jgi:adenosine deaminase
MTLSYMPSETERALLAKLPKIELHVHLDGSVKPDTIKEFMLAAHDLPESHTTEAELLAHMQVDEQCASLVEYLAKFSFVLPYLQTAEALERIAYELVEQAAAGQVRYMEVRFAPLLHVRKDLTIAGTIEAVLAGLERGERTCGTIARAIIICLRSHDEESNTKVLEAAAVYHGQGVVAVDLAGDEASHPPERFRSSFDLARQHGLPVTIHAGEAGGAANVRTAVEQLGARRIGHGVRMVEDESVIELVKERGIALEICPLSNIQTKAIPDWESYPLRRYLESGIRVTVNTDNMTVSGTTLQQEFELLLKHCGITLNQVAQMIMNGACSAFLEGELKQALIAQVAGELEKLGFEWRA